MMSRNNSQTINIPFVTNVSIHVVPEDTRSFFYWLILVIAILAVIGNVLAIRSIFLKNYKFVQKTCIISLAVADIFSVVFFAINYLETLSQQLIIWSLGEFMCKFIPMAQVLGTTASSVALLVIALDRYQNVVFALGKRWEPTRLTCSLITLALWIMCIATSYPMFIFFEFPQVAVIYVPTTTLYPEPEYAHMCIAINKQGLTAYYVTIAVLVFFPIIAIFFWFYYSIAALIWKHRKPLSLRFSPKKKRSEPDDSSTTKSTELSANAGKNLKAVVPKKTKNVQVERKIRTFKIVVVLMATFIICRMPYWCFYVAKLLKTFNSSTYWNIHFALIALNMFNCVLNPLLYTFLSETMNVLRMMNDFMCKICCCCFSNAEFEDFEKDNPFARENYEIKKVQVVKEHLKDTKKSNVKFVGLIPLAESQDSNSIGVEKY